MDIKINYIKTKNNKTNLVCNNCPYKLYDTNKNIYLGQGNINSGIAIIYKGGNYNKCKLPVEEELLSIYYNNIANHNLYEDFYITRYIKCSITDNINYEIENDNCFNFLLYELIKLKITKIILVGSKLKNINFYLKQYLPNIVIVNMISPLIIKIDETKENYFIKSFNNALYNIKL